LIGFIAFCQSRSSKTKRGISRHPASVLAPESALGSLPSVALSSAQAGRILTHESKLLKSFSTNHKLTREMEETEWIFVIFLWSICTLVSFGAGVVIRTYVTWLPSFLVMAVAPAVLFILAVGRANYVVLFIFGKPVLITVLIIQTLVGLAVAKKGPERNGVDEQL
jgi:hypothetical protein